MCAASVSVHCADQHRGIGDKISAKLHASSTTGHNDSAYTTGSSLPAGVRHAAALDAD